MGDKKIVICWPILYRMHALPDSNLNARFETFTSCCDACFPLRPSRHTVHAKFTNTACMREFHPQPFILHFLSPPLLPSLPLSLSPLPPALPLCVSILLFSSAASLPLLVLPCVLPSSMHFTISSRLVMDAASPPMALSLLLQLYEMERDDSTPIRRN